MEGLIILILFALFILIVVLPIAAFARSGTAVKEAREAHDRIRELERRSAIQQRELAELRAGTAPASASEPIPAPIAAAEERFAWETASAEDETPSAPVMMEATAAVPPPLPAAPDAFMAEASSVSEEDDVEPAENATDAGVPARPVFSIEQFLGVKMFAWLGGIALFFGVIFFVKYAFEHNLIPPAVRIAMGFVAGISLLGGGLRTHRAEAYRVLAQSLCATGVLVLYGVSFAAHAVYHFPAFGPAVTFSLMGLITVTAFLTAIRLNALVVAVLGMLGGFVTPVLLPMVQDHPFALFGYIALLDAGLLAITMRGRWKFLATGAAAGTVLMQVGWVTERFVAGRYFEGTSTLVPMGILLFFAALFLAAAWRTSGDESEDIHVPGSAFAVLAAGLGFAFFFLTFESITQRVFLLYGYVLLLNLAAIALGWLHARFSPVQNIISGVTFLHLVAWTIHCLKPDLLGPALAIYLVFGLLHSLWPVVAGRLRPDNDDETTRLALRISLWLPTAILGLMALTLFVLPQVSMALWPAILLTNLLGLGLAAHRGEVVPVLAALATTMLTATVWLFRMPPVIDSLPSLLGIVLFFSLFFTGAGVWLAKRFPGSADIGGLTPAKMLPMASGVMPFFLLILMVIQLPLVNPTPVFGAGLLLAVLLLGVTLLGRLPLLAPCALACCLALEGTWHLVRFDAAQPWPPLAWYLVFYLVFGAFPFVFRRSFVHQTAPWIASALSGVGHFLLVHDLVRRAFPNEMMGLLPAAFAVPSIVALVIVLRAFREMDSATRSRLAWFGGVALLFITLIFPIQFDRQWLTVGWALEGACLVWLFRRVPHSGLLGTGLFLLAVAFIRLTFNPAVFAAYPRSGTHIFNWHLYVYGIAAAAQFLGAWWIPEQCRTIRGISLRAALCSLGGVLLFLLLNIEIADFFTLPGERFIAFQFAGNFARDMTYTISWGLFALALLVIGISCHARGARFAAIGLLAATLLKLFLHDLATIGNIYRIAALLCVGVIAFIASFLYQRFLSRPDKS